MKDKLAEYINTIFADAERNHPGNPKLADLKEEMLQNLNEKYDDLIANGKSPAAAYNIAVSSIGDISDLLESVCGPTPEDNEQGGPHRQEESAPRPLTPEENERRETYRNRSAILTSVAIALYILCCVPCILLGNLGNGIVGVTVMFVMIAAATAMLIFNAMTKPKFADETDDDRADRNDSDREDDDLERRSPVYRAISGALWALTVCVYLLVSFLSMQWHITWLIFLIAVAADNIIKAIFDLRR